MPNFIAVEQEVEKNRRSMEKKQVVESTACFNVDLACDNYLHNLPINLFFDLSQHGNCAC